jgi:hypothetical protein
VEPSCHVIVDDSLASVVVEMLRGSHTFQRQCQRLGSIRELRVRVSVEPEIRTARSDCNARCVIERYQYGRIEAETARAIGAGEQVASEMSRYRSRHPATTLARRVP